MTLGILVHHRPAPHAAQDLVILVLAHAHDSADIETGEVSHDVDDLDQAEGSRGHGTRGGSLVAAAPVAGIPPRL